VPRKKFLFLFFTLLCDCDTKRFPGKKLNYRQGHKKGKTLSSKKKSKYCSFPEKKKKMKQLELILLIPVWA
jgi:hypothetical protein